MNTFIFSISLLFNLTLEIIQPSEISYTSIQPSEIIHSDIKKNDTKPIAQVSFTGGGRNGSEFSLCPVHIYGKVFQRWVLHGNPPHCYPVGEQGPCPEDMKLVNNASSFFGSCNCSCFKNSTDDEQNPYCKISEMKAVSYWPDTGLCYPLYSQGPCEEPKDWFVIGTDLNSDTKAICEKRKCPHNMMATSFYDRFTNSCKEIGEECRNGNGRYIHVDWTWYPQCIILDNFRTYLG